ncbi:MAG: RNA polymerase sigma factor, partial [Gaiellaceae bacterium]
AARQRPASCESDAARLFEAHADQIFGYCLRRSGSRSDAEDALQTTFLYAFRALRRGVVPECESAWLTTIARNVCRWQHRTLDRRGSLAGEIDPDSVGDGERFAPDDEELCDALKSALASLPETQRRALVLSEWHGLSSGEVAAQLGLSTPATYALLTRARRSMARALTTAPRQAALGLATIVCEFRRTIKGLLGSAGAAAKTVAATTVVATVAAGGVSAASPVEEDRATPQAPAPEVVVVESRAADAPSVAVLTEHVVRTAPGTLPGPDSTEPGVLAGEDPGAASPSTGEATPSQSPDETVATVSAELDPLTEIVPELPPLPAPVPELPPLPVPELPTDALPTDALPPAPELPPVPSVPESEPVPPLDPTALPPLPDPGLPSLP